MAARRCDGCAYWVEGEQWRNDAETDPDEWNGACHRYAPRPTLGDFEHEVVKFLSTLAWEVSDAKARETEFLQWEEAYLAAPSWPRTNGADWCGEWREREA